MNQKGFIALPIAAWGAIGAAVVIAGLGVAVKVQTSRLDAAKSDLAVQVARYEAFSGQVRLAGEKAQKAAADREAADKQRKESADAENVRSRAAYDRVLASLRDERARRNSAGSFVPAAASPSLGLKLACYDGARLDDALRRLDLGVQALVDRGAKAELDLNTAKAWAAR